MTDAVLLVLAFIAGGLIGAAFFILLWWNVRRLPRVDRPGLFVLAGLVLRLAIFLAGFYAIARAGSWTTVVAALAGFILVRFLMIRAVTGRWTGRPFAEPKDTHGHHP